MRRTFVAKVVLFSALFVPLGPAQVAETPDNDIPKFTSRSDLVLVPTVVTDKSGRHVEGLKKEDFTILENGHPRPIAVFEEVHTADRMIAPLSATQGVYSNFIPNDGINRRLVIIVLDMLNTPFAVRSQARAALLANVPKLIDPSMPVAFITLERDGLHQVHSLTSDPRALQAALDRVNRTIGGPVGAYPATSIDSNPNLSTSYTAHPTEIASDVRNSEAGAAQARNAAANPSIQISDPDEAQRDFNALAGVYDGIYDSSKGGIRIGPPSDSGRVGSNFGHSGPGGDAAFASYQTHQDVDITLFSLEQIARAYSGIPGRKIMIWVTGGLPMNIMDPTSISSFGDLMLDDYRRTWRALSESGISVYPVDALGLTGESHHILTETLREFAEATGGQAYYNRNDIVTGVTRAAEDAKQYYEIGFYLPKESHGKPEWSKLKVKVDRHDVEIHTREGFLSGYSATPNTRDLKREMELAFASPVDYTGFPVQLKVDPPASDGQVHVHLSVPAHSFKIDRDNNNYANIEFAAVALGPQRFSKGLFAQRIVGNLTPANADRIANDGLTWNDNIAVPSQANRIKFVVRDNLTGKIGSVVAFVNPAASPRRN